MLYNEYMFIIKLLFFNSFILLNSYALDFGTGADGACSFNGAINTDVKDVYNCSSVIILTPTVTGSKALIIKSLDSVTISGTLSLDGGDGGVGSNGGGSTAGVAGPGGFAGGACPSDNSACNDGEGGGYSGEGKRGTFLTHSSAGPNDARGGGGGGARFGNQLGLLSSGSDGADEFNLAASGGAAGSSSYAPEVGFENLLIGGSGGGAGGSSELAPGGGGVNPHSGGAGGGGGGAVRIITQNDIIVEVGGSITANGGDGGDGAGAVSSGGGAGSGGAIFLQAGGAIIVNGQIRAEGGTGGDGAAALNNDGGNGGSGRIRYDDSDGIITGTGTTTPTAVVNTIQVSGSAAQSASYDSSIACGAIGLTEKEKAINSLVTIFLLLLVGNIISKKSHYI